MACQVGRCEVLLVGIVMRLEMMSGWWVRDMWLFCLASRKAVPVKFFRATEIYGM